MRRLLIALGASLAGLLVFQISWHPQSVYLESSASYFPWEPVGPYNLGHILTCGVRFGNKVFVGSAFGGLYESGDGGRSWKPVQSFTLNQNGEAVYRALSVVSLAVDGNNLYVGTGNVPLFNAAGVSHRVIDTLRGNILGGFGLPGMGVYVSSDGGNTFSNQNSTWRLSYPAISYRPAYEGAGAVVNVIDIAASEGKVAILAPDSLLISLDGLQTIEKRPIPGGRPPRSVTWGANGTLFLATTDTLYRSEDNGQSFTPIRGLSLPSEVTQPGTSSAYGRSGFGGSTIVVRAAPSNPNIIYAASAGSTGRLICVWASSDNGLTWNAISSAQNASFNVLDSANVGILALRIDPQDPTRILIGGRQIWEFSPQNGWQRIIPSNVDGIVLSLPRPIRDFVFLDNGAFLVIGTGRLLRIIDNGTRAEDATRGIQASPILSVSIASNGDLYASGPTPLNITMHYTESDPIGIFRLLNLGSPFSPVTSPVGYVAASMRFPGSAYFSYQGGRLRLSTDRSGRFLSVYNPPAPSAFYRQTTADSIQPPSNRTSFTEDRPAAAGPVYPPFALVESFPELLIDRNRYLAGVSHLFIATSRHLWYISNSITNVVDSLQYWSRVSPTFISNLTAAATIPDYYRSTNSIPTAMAVSLDDNGDCTVWIGSSNGELRRIQKAQDITLDRSASYNFENLTPSIATLLEGRTISAIAIHPKNPDLLAIATSSYRGPDARIFLTTNARDANPNFISIHGNLPNIPVYSLFFHPDSARLLLAGTQWGLWRCVDVSNPTWEEMTGETVGRVPVTAIAWKPYRYQIDTVDRSDPEAPVWEARALPDPERPIYIATWGRGIWKISSRSATSLPTAASAQPIRVEAFPNPFGEDIKIKLSAPMGTKQISWQLLNLSGQRLGGHTHSDPLPAGEHTFSWRVGQLPLGVYFIQVEAIDQQGRRYAQTFKLLHQ
ncbi:MAG: hypothetical protein N3E49_01520 [Bacteroidia bacterium]|nr:hypothetical protein [Bacteroidia bacterium]